MSGIEFLNHLKSTDFFSKIHFIFLTAKTAKEDLTAGMQLAADDYIIKPFKAEALIKAIQTNLGKNRFIAF